MIHHPAAIVTCRMTRALEDKSATCTAASYVNNEGAKKRQLLPVQVLADLHGIMLPSPEELPPSYTSMRMWLTRRIATLQGRHKETWLRIKSDPVKLQAVRAATRQRVHRWRMAHQNSSATQSAGS